MDPRAELEAAWREWRLRPSPVIESDDEDVDELWAQLIDFDAWAAGLISSVIGRTRRDERPEPDPQLRARIAQRATDKDPSVVADARRLADYLDGLERLVALAARVAL